MHFLKLLKIERIKCKRSKIIPFIFIAPILVVSSGVANLSTYFTPGIHPGMACHVYSECPSLRLLSAAFQYDRCLRHDYGTGKQSQRAAQDAGTSSQPPYPVTGQILYTGFLPVDGNSCISGCFRNCRIHRCRYFRHHRNPAPFLPFEMVCGIISNHASKSLCNVDADRFV